MPLRPSCVTIYKQKTAAPSTTYSYIRNAWVVDMGLVICTHYRRLHFADIYIYCYIQFKSKQSALYRVYLCQNYLTNYYLQLFDVRLNRYLIASGGRHNYIYGRLLTPYIYRVFLIKFLQESEVNRKHVNICMNHNHFKRMNKLVELRKDTLNQAHDLWGSFHSSLNLPLSPYLPIHLLTRPPNHQSDCLYTLLSKV